MEKAYRTGLTTQSNPSFPSFLFYSCHHPAGGILTSHFVKIAMSASLKSPDPAFKDTPNENAPLAKDISRPDSPADEDPQQRRRSIPLAGLEGLTLYEKKCVLINREIDAQGMGRYQWYIWGLCGFGYLLDLLWAHAFGLVLSPLQQELGFGNNRSGNISTSFNAGLTAGAFVWGFLSDVVGETMNSMC